MVDVLEHVRDLQEVVLCFDEVSPKPDEEGGKLGVDFAEFTPMNEGQNGGAVILILNSKV